jgi:hypothetical protein
LDDLFKNIPSLVDDLDNQMLTRMPTETEIWNTINSMNKEGPPGPDGFTAKFFHTQWSVVKKDLCNAIFLFFKGHPLTRVWKETFISLIPKNENPSSFKDFGPISLNNVTYKIIFKILASRLESILPKLISLE